MSAPAIPLLMGVTGADETEAAFQQAVMALARYGGWETHHEYDSRRSSPGFPDLTLVKGPRLIFAELKTNRGRLRHDQRRWLMMLAAAPGVEVALWRPVYWPNIVAALLHGERIPTLSLDTLTYTRPRHATATPAV